jgi:hypothetical protein
LIIARGILEALKMEARVVEERITIANKKEKTCPLQSSRENLNKLNHTDKN